MTDKENLDLRIAVLIVAKFIAKIVYLSAGFILFVMHDTTIAFVKLSVTETTTNFSARLLSAKFS